MPTSAVLASRSSSLLIPYMAESAVYELTYVFLQASLMLNHNFSIGDLNSKCTFPVCNTTSNTHAVYRIEAVLNIIHAQQLYFAYSALKL